MTDDIYRFVTQWLPSHVNDNRSHLTVAIGCTGVQHRFRGTSPNSRRAFRESAGCSCGTAPSRPDPCRICPPYARWLAAWAVHLRMGDGPCWRRRWRSASDRPSCCGRAAGQTKAIIKAGGQVFAEVDLSARASSEVPGPFGTTRIEVQPGRARVASDPGPRQYCVRQGWLASARRGWRSARPIR